MPRLVALLVAGSAAALMPGGVARADDLTYLFAGDLTRGLGIKIDHFETACAGSQSKGAPVAMNACVEGVRIDVTRHKDEFSARLEAAFRSQATVKTVVIKSFATPFTGVQDTFNEVRIVNYSTTADAESFSLVFRDDSSGIWSDESRPALGASSIPVEAILPHRP